MIIITVSRSSTSCFFPAVYRLIKGPHDFSILIPLSNDFSVYMTHRVKHFALGDAVFMYTINLNRDKDRDARNTVCP